nr:immunoglobulin light chain junction region [Macaca mulatta]
CCQYYTGYTF